MNKEMASKKLSLFLLSVNNIQIYLIIIRKNHFIYSKKFSTKNFILSADFPFVISNCFSPILRSAALSSRRKV